MRFSQALIPTLRDAPKEAELISHKLLVRDRRGALIPYQVVIGPRGLKNQTVELQRRHDGQKREISYAQGLDSLVQTLTTELAR